MNMKSKIATTVEQSIKLAELGIDPSTSDMHWESIYNDEYRLALSTTKEAVEAIERMQDSLKTTFNVKLVPAWSLSALMNIMPKGYVLIKDSVNENYHLYSKGYIPCKCISAENPIDVVFEMVCYLYLKENKYI